MQQWLLLCSSSNGCYSVLNKRTGVVHEPESCIDHIYINDLSTGIKPYYAAWYQRTLPIYLTVSKTRLKRDIKQKFFRDTRNVEIIALDRDLRETLDTLLMQYSEWNANEKFDFTAPL